MKRFVNYLRGTARVSVEGGFPERVINLCAQNGVEFWAVEWQGDSQVHMTIRIRGIENLLRFAEKVDCQVSVKEKRGAPEFLMKFRQRYGFLIGLAAALLTVFILSGFVLSVEVTGNERIPDAVILQQLRRFGVRPGVYAPGLDRRQIEQEILGELDELAWMTINLHGTQVKVQVLEKQEAPERVDERGLYHIVAETDGIVTAIEPESGDAMVQKGDTVGKGDVLISGIVTLEPPQYSDLPERYYHVHARGSVWARTWRQVTAVIPVEVAVKSYTGKESVRYALKFSGSRVEFFGNSSNLRERYDRISSVRRLVLPGGIELPVWVVREYWREYEHITAELDAEAAAKLLSEELCKRIRCLIGDDGQMINVEYETCIADGLLRVTAVGECLEEIGQELADEHGR